MSDTKDDQIDKARDLLNKRQQAYHQVFGEASGEFAKIILGDLARFCRANESAFHPDARIHASLEGRREVWLRIQDHLKLTPKELYSKTLQKWGINGDSTSNSNKRANSGDATKFTSGTAGKFTSDDSVWLSGSD